MIVYRPFDCLEYPRVVFYGCRDSRRQATQPPFAGWSIANVSVTRLGPKYDTLQPWYRHCGHSLPSLATTSSAARKSITRRRASTVSKHGIPRDAGIARPNSNFSCAVHYQSTFLNRYALWFNSHLDRST